MYLTEEQIKRIQDSIRILIAAIPVSNDNDASTIVRIIQCSDYKDYDPTDIPTHMRTQVEILRSYLVTFFVIVPDHHESLNECITEVIDERVEYLTSVATDNAVRNEYQRAQTKRGLLHQAGWSEFPYPFKAIDDFIGFHKIANFVVILNYSCPFGATLLQETEDLTNFISNRDVMAISTPSFPFHHLVGVIERSRGNTLMNTAELTKLAELINRGNDCIIEQTSSQIIETLYQLSIGNANGRQLAKVMDQRNYRVLEVMGMQFLDALIKLSFDDAKKLIESFNNPNLNSLLASRDDLVGFFQNKKVTLECKQKVCLALCNSAVVACFNGNSLTIKDLRERDATDLAKTAEILQHAAVNPFSRKGQINAAQAEKWGLDRTVEIATRMSNPTVLPLVNEGLIRALDVSNTASVELLVTNAKLMQNSKVYPHMQAGVMSYWDIERFGSNNIQILGELLSHPDNVWLSDNKLFAVSYRLLDANNDVSKVKILINTLNKFKEAILHLPLDQPSGEPNESTVRDLWRWFIEKMVPMLLRKREEPNDLDTILKGIIDLFELSPIRTFLSEYDYYNNHTKLKCIIDHFKSLPKPIQKFIRDAIEQNKFNPLLSYYNKSVSLYETFLDAIWHPKFRQLVLSAKYKSDNEDLLGKWCDYPKSRDSLLLIQQSGQAISLLNAALRASGWLPEEHIHTTKKEAAILAKSFILAEIYGEAKKPFWNTLGFFGSYPPDGVRDLKNLIENLQALTEQDTSERRDNHQQRINQTFEAVESKLQQRLTSFHFPGTQEKPTADFYRKYHRLIQCFHTIEKLQDPKESYYEIGKKLMELGNDAAAYSCFSGTRIADPNFRLAAFEAGKIAFTQGKYELAQGHLMLLLRPKTESQNEVENLEDALNLLEDVNKIIDGNAETLEQRQSIQEQENQFRGMGL